ASLLMAARAPARKAWTLSAAGLSPSRNSLRSGTSGPWRGAGTSSLAGMAGRLLGGMESIWLPLLAERDGHKADSVPSNRLHGQDVTPTQVVTANIIRS